MKYALTAEMARYVDEYTTKEAGLPSICLMERAALCVAEKVAQVAAMMHRPARILAIAGAGNNGADAIAAARILSWQGLPCDILLLGDPDKAGEDYRVQLAAAKNTQMNFVAPDSIDSYDIVIDGIFGNGLNREITGEYAERIAQINDSRNVVISVDVPSGVHATTGAVLGVAIKADITVTFGFHKEGLLLYPGKAYAGEVTVADIGLYPKALMQSNPTMYFTPEDLGRIPARQKDANKGTYGRIVVIAGSEDMSGAAYFSGAAAYRTGCGLVEILTAECNSEVIRRLLPEAIVTGYTAENAVSVISEKLGRASVIVLGPGLSVSELSRQIVDTVLKEGAVPLIADADALNIMASLPEYSYPESLILTPHIGEMARLSGLTKEEILSDTIGVAKDYAKKHEAIVVLKNAATVVAEPNERMRTYINTSGTPALAKGGSGDVLSGMIAGLLALRLEPFSAAAMGVYLHGICGECAATELGEHAVMASDLIARIGKVMDKEH